VDSSLCGLSNTPHSDVRRDLAMLLPRQGADCGP
jgi:hypothetical protein